MRNTRPGLRTVDAAILARIASFDSNAPAPFDATALDDDALRTEYARIKERGGELSAKETLTGDETTELTELSSRVDAVNAELSARKTAAETAQASRDKFAALPDLEPVAPVEPVTPVTPAEPAPVVPAEPAAVQAAAAPVVPSITTLAPTTPQAPVVPVRNAEFSVALTADGAGALKRAYNDDSAVTVMDVTKAVLASFKTYGHAGGGGQSAKRAIAQFSRDRGAEFQVHGQRPEDDLEALTRIGNERRLEGGSLLTAWARSTKLDNGDGASLQAAAGWCAPSENLYDLCSLWSMDGMVDLPTATATRGGFNYTNQPTYAQLDANLSFTILTEAQVIAETPKNCAEIPCPTFTDVRLDVAVSCITASFLQAAGYPELVNTWVDGLLTNHAHKLNENIIGRMVTAAGAAVVIPAQGAAGGTGTTPDASATSSILYAIDLAATDMRYQSRMPFNQTFEVVLPQWVLVQMRADIGRKNGWASDNYDLQDAEIVRWFTTRGIRPQFVYDWQDALSGLAAGPGGAAALTTLPATVQFLIYPAGAVVLARQDVVTLSNVYDSANLTQNLYTRLFAEEGFNLIFPCGPIRLYTAQACPSGATAAQAYTACAAAAA
jgi:hypothetical protein